jgi:hypothetical protein
MERRVTGKDRDMHTLQQSYKGLSLMWELNLDRVLFVITILLALMAGAWLGTL